MMKRLGLVVVCAGLLVGAGCGDEDSNNEANNSQAETQETRVRFDAVVGAEAFGCGKTFMVGSPAVAVEVSDFKAYVSEVKLITTSGEIEATLVSDGVWQTDYVALLDFEDGSGACANGTAETNDTIVLSHRKLAEGESITGVAWTFGVPFEHNHQDQATAPSPLNLTSMFWSWQAGYKFLRLDGKAGDAGWRVHLGSTGCEKDASDAVTGCAKPNRATVSVSGVTGATPTVRLDVAALMAGVDLTPDADNNSAICMSSPDHAVCGSIFGALGLPFGENSPAQVFATAQ